MANLTAGRTALFLSVTGFIAGCGEDASLNLFEPKPDTEVTSGADGPVSTRLIERDVEVPEVFQVIDQGLWDGRPSLGGVWVAHPDVTEPERVIIRNEANGKFVIGALFRRERENPGPVFQISSDAAAALGILAGAPGQLNVTALRRQEVPISGEVPGAEAASGATDLDTAGGEGANLDGAGLDTVETSSLDTPETIETTALEALNEESASVEEANAETLAEPGPVNPVLDITAADLPPVDNGSFELARAALEAAGALPPPGFDIPLGAVATTALPDPAPVETASLEENPSPAPLVTPLPAPKPERDLTSVVPTAAPVPEDTAPKPVISGAGSSLDEPFIQIGLFSVEANAQRSGDRLRNEGILPVVVKDEVNGTTYWRVLAGPSPNEAERETLLAKVQALGYAGAYFVTN